LTGIADLVGSSDDDVRKRMKTLDFGKYVELMRALRDRNEDVAKEVLGLSIDEAYSTGSQGTRTSLTPGEMKGVQQAQAQQQPDADADPSTMSKKAQAMQRLGKKALGGISGQQAAKALDRAEQGKVLTPVQRFAMSQQAKSVSALANDPKTAQQFRSLLNKLNK
jgi:hypothetical protein